MKITLNRFLAAAAFAAASLTGSAQPAVKLVVVDMLQLYQTHFRTEEQTTKLNADGQKAQEELERLNKEIAATAEEIKGLEEQMQNPALSAEAKQKIQADGQGKVEAFQQKRGEAENFRVNALRQLQQRERNFRDLMFEEITKVATEIAKKKGATLLIDKSGPSLLQVSNILFVDPAYDITEEVKAVLNKDRPAGSPAPAPAAAPAVKPAAPAAPAASSDTGTVTFPGSKKN